MYKCEFCNSLIQKNVKTNRVVVETRKVTYPFYKKPTFSYNNRPNFRNNNSESEDKPVNEQGRVGYETVREKLACSECEKKYATKDLESLSKQG